MAIFTQQELAELAGVSKATVQRALKGGHYVKPGIRDKILRLANKHGYRAHASAASLRSGRTHAIGVLMFNKPQRSEPHASAMVFFEYLAGVTDRLLEHDYKTILVRDHQLKAKKDSSDGPSIPILFRERSVDGIINTHPLLRPLEEQVGVLDVPTVWLDAGRAEDYGCIWRDDAAAVELAVDRLVELGHKRIAYIHKEIQHPMAPDDELYPIHHSIGARRQAYQAMMKKHGMSEILIATDSAEQGEGAIVDSLNSKNRPTAYLSYSCELASWMRCACEQIGMRLGTDVSLISLDDTFDTHRNWSKLGRVEFNRYEMGFWAADMMLDLIRKNQAPASRCFTPRKLLGSTFGIAPGI